MSDTTPEALKQGLYDAIANTSHPLEQGAYDALWNAVFSNSWNTEIMAAILEDIASNKLHPLVLLKIGQVAGRASELAGAPSATQPAPYDGPEPFIGDVWEHLAKLPPLDLSLSREHAHTQAVLLDSIRNAARKAESPQELGALVDVYLKLPPEYDDNPPMPDYGLPDAN